MTKAAKGHLALFVAQVIYALNYSIAKGLMPDYLGPFAIVLLRVIGATILFWLVSLFVKTQPVEKKDLIKMLWLSLFGVVINQVFFIWGLSLTSPINSSIIMISNPIMVFLFTMAIFKERITLMKFTGLGLAVLGALMILLYKDNFQMGSETVKGDLMTLLNSISWGIFIVLVKPLMQKYNTVTAMRWIFLFGTIFTIPVCLNGTLDTDWAGMTSGAWMALAFVVIATTFFAYLLNIYGLVELSSNTVSAYIYLQPFLASLFAIIIGKDNLTPTKVLSGFLIILGLYLVNRKPAIKE
jgi:drug/metabolite transporter (DMT)-like permease